MLKCCDRKARLTVFPIFTFPLMVADASALGICSCWICIVCNKVVFPHPLSPTIPMRSPGPMLHVMSFRTVCGGVCGEGAGYDTLKPWKLITSFPRRVAAMRLRVSELRSGACAPASAFACATWNFGFVARARAPRASHASSRRNLFCWRSQVTSRTRSRSTRCKIYAEKPPSKGSTRPS